MITYIATEMPRITAQNLVRFLEPGSLSSANIGHTGAGASKKRVGFRTAHQGAFQRQPAREARDITDRYRAEWQKLGKPISELPLLGIARQMVVAENESEAKHAAQRAYRPWRKHLELLWKQHGIPFRLTMFPLEVDELLDSGGAFAGTAEGARAYIQKQTETSGVNYFVCDISFGDLTPAEAMRTVQLLAREVVPAFSDRAGAAGVD